MKFAIAVLICIASAAQTFAQLTPGQLPTRLDDRNSAKSGPPATTQPGHKVHTKLEVGMTKVEMRAFLKSHPNMKILSEAIVAATDGSKDAVDQVEVVTYSSQVKGGIREITERLNVQLRKDVISAVNKEPV